MVLCIFFYSNKTFCNSDVFPVRITAITGSNLLFVLEKVLTKVDLISSGKKSKSVFDFLTYSKETWFSFSYGEDGNFDQPIIPSNKIDRGSKFDNVFSFCVQQNALQQICFQL